MYGTIILACKALDAFGLPRAVGSLDTDRFVVANKAFLRITGFDETEVLSIRLSEIVNVIRIPGKRRRSDPWFLSQCAQAKRV